MEGQYGTIWHNRGLSFTPCRYDERHGKAEKRTRASGFILSPTTLVGHPRRARSSSAPTPEARRSVIAEVFADREVRVVTATATPTQHHLDLQEERSSTRRRVRNGHPTNDLVFSARVGGNEDVFPDILKLYVSPGSTVADVTYGKGVFWRNIAGDRYILKATDILNGVDCRDLPYDDGSMDCVVLDPPYMHTPGGTAHTAHTAFERHYRNNGTGNRTARKYHDAVLALYEEAGAEAHRVLKKRGVLIVKCQDEVCSNRQCFTHVEIIQAYEELGFVAEDLFVVVRQNRPGVSRAVRQVHARKNHSYFLVFWKGNGVWKPPA